MSIQILLIAIGISLVSGFGAGWKTNAWKVGAEYAAQLSAQKTDYEKKLSKTEAMLSKVAEEKQKTRIVYREIRHEVQSTNLGTCALSDDALKLLMDASSAGADASPASGKPNATLPTTTGTKVR